LVRISTKTELLLFRCKEVYLNQTSRLRVPSWQSCGEFDDHWPLIWQANSKPSHVLCKVRISEVISNLLGNAIKFTTKEAGRDITIKVEKKNNEANVSIKDSGSGINPEIKPKLFSKFVTNSPGGTGIGLFISKSIVEAHGGRIWADNNAETKGATFTFSLPIAQ